MKKKKMIAASSKDQFFNAIKQGNLDLVMQMANFSLMNEEDEDSDSPLHMAASFNQPHVLDFLLKRFRLIDVDPNGCSGRTPLNFAAYEGTKILN